MSPPVAAAHGFALTKIKPPRLRSRLIARPLLERRSTSISLAAWETRAHFGRGASLPWNRYLVQVDVPDDVWAAREVLMRPPAIGWDAIPEGLVSRASGSVWLNSGRTALLAVPSVIIVEEDNVLINPVHPDAKRITAIKVRRFVYDHRD